MTPLQHMHQHLKHPSKMKYVSKQALANLVLVLLVFYLILAVEQLRAGNCSSALSTAADDPLSAPPVLSAPGPAHPPAAPAAPDAAAAPNAAPAAVRAASAARRQRPMPACARRARRARSFLMVFMGHSGSTAIATELRQHPQVHMEGAELVDHQPVFDTDAALQTTRAFFERGIAKGKTPGFKIRPAHILTEPDKWRALVTEYGTRIIWQYRKNLFKAAVGEYSNRYLNDSSVVEGFKTNISRAERCHIGVGCSFKVANFTFMHGVIRGMLRNQHFIVDAVNALVRDTACVRELPYEDYLYEREQTMADLRRFLGLRHEATEPLRYKATDDNMCSVVENWGELCKHFYGCTLFQHMMDDPRNGCYCPFTAGPTQFCKLL